MIRPVVTPALGPLDRLNPEPSLPTLSLTAEDVVAIVAQQFELAGIPVNLSAESLGVATCAAEVMRAALLFSPVPGYVPPVAAVTSTPLEETDVSGL